MMFTRSLSRKLSLTASVLASATALIALTAASASAAGYHWYAGGEPVGSSPVAVSGANSGAFNFGFVVSGVVFNAECKSVSAAGSVSNPVGSPAGILTGGSFAIKNCGVTVPRGNGCQFGDITTSPLKGSPNAGGIAYAPEKGTILFEFTISGCAHGGLNGVKAVTGTMAAVPSATSPGTYEFNISSSVLNWGGQAAYLTGSYNLATKAGAALTVGL